MRTAVALGSSDALLIMQPRCFKARQRDARAATYVVYEVLRVLLIYPYLACDVMAQASSSSIWRTTTRSLYEVKPISLEYSGSKNDFECIPDKESGIWTLFELPPAQVRAIIAGLRIKESELIYY